MKTGFVYIVTNKNNTTLYVGVTSDLKGRITKHREKKYKKSFTANYNVDKLVYYECLPSMHEAIAREKQLKAGSRTKKMTLVEGLNREWSDLYEGLV